MTKDEIQAIIEGRIREQFGDRMPTPAEIKPVLMKILEEMMVDPPFKIEAGPRPGEMTITTSEALVETMLCCQIKVTKPNSD